MCMCVYVHVYLCTHTHIHVEIRSQSQVAFFKDYLPSRLRLAGQHNMPGVLSVCSGDQRRVLQFVWEVLTELVLSLAQMF